MSDLKKLRAQIDRLAAQAEGCAAAPMDGETASDVYRWVATRLRDMTGGQQDGGSHG